MTDKKILTICIATYNRSSIVVELVKELLGFDLNDQIEILIIDDCSSDNTFQSLTQFDGLENVSIYKNQENLSRARTQLKYFDLCKTEFLLDMHDDDFLFRQGLLDLLQLLPSLQVDFLSTNWVDYDGSIYPRGSDSIQPISLINLREKSEHVVGCVYRTSMIDYSKKYLLDRLEKNCSVAFFWHQNIVLAIGMLNGLSFYSSPILMGGFGKNIAKSNYLDSNGDGYLSLPVTIKKFLGMKNFYEDMLKQFPNSPLFSELKAVYDSYNLSFYNSLEDSLALLEEKGDLDLVKIIRAGAISKTLHPWKGLKSFFWFVKVRLNVIKFRLIEKIKRIS